jgi:hypothetical protein
MEPSARTTVTWHITPGLRSAIDAEALRSGIPPSRVVERLLLKYLPDFLAESVRASLHRDRPDGDDTDGDDMQAKRPGKTL